MQLDEVLGLPARAIEGGVNPFRRAVFDVGDDETGVEPERSGFDAGDGASLAAPGFGLVALVDQWMASYEREPASVILDIDDTCDVVHGHQQLSLFNAHYDERCFLPIHVYDTERSRPVAPT